MNRSVLVLVCAASILIPATAATATVTVFDATLTGAAEVPPVGSPGTAFATITVDNILFTMHVQTNFSGLLSPTTAALIHCCAPPGANTGVATLTSPLFPLGVTSGTSDYTFDMTLASSYNPAFVTANGGTAASAFAVLLSGMLAGDAYLNIHTSSFPGGEIRGQLEPVPEASTWAMMLLGWGAVGASLRRGRKSAPDTGSDELSLRAKDRS